MEGLTAVQPIPICQLSSFVTMWWGYNHTAGIPSPCAAVTSSCAAPLHPLLDSLFVRCMAQAILARSQADLHLILPVIADPSALREGSAHPPAPPGPEHPSLMYLIRTCQPQASSGLSLPSPQPTGWATCRQRTGLVTAFPLSRMTGRLQLGDAPCPVSGGKGIASRLGCVRRFAATTGGLSTSIPCQAHFLLCIELVQCMPLPSPARDRARLPANHSNISQVLPGAAP